MVYTADFEKDMDAVTEILARDFSERFSDPKKNGVDHRLIWLKQHIDRDDLIVCRGGRRYAARRTGRDKAERQRK